MNLVMRIKGSIFKHNLESRHCEINILACVCVFMRVSLDSQRPISFFFECAKSYLVLSFNFSMNNVASASNNLHVLKSFLVFLGIH